MNPDQNVQTAERVNILRPAAPTEISEFFRKVYGWMCLGLIVSGVVAYFVSVTPAWYEVILGNRAAFLGALVVEFGLVIWLTAGINKMSARTAFISFLIYCFVSGLTLSVVFLAYTATSIQTVLFVTAGMFGVISLYGYTTGADLSRTGQIAFMGLIGVIIAAVVNMFVGNSSVDLILSVISVLVFAVLTAYDTQKIKKFVVGIPDSEMQQKASIIGALTLYLDFINLFLNLLRLMGKRK